MIDDHPTLEGHRQADHQRDGDPRFRGFPDQGAAQRQRHQQEPEQVNELLVRHRSSPLHLAQQVKQRKNNQPDQVGGVPVGGECLHALVVLRAVGARLGACDHPQQPHHSPQDMHHVGKGQVVIDREEDAGSAGDALADVPAELEILGDHVAACRNQHQNQPADADLGAILPDRDHRIGDEIAAGDHQQRVERAGDQAQPQWAVAEGLRKVRPGDEVHAEQQREFGHLGQDAGPDALVARNDAGGGCLLGVGGGQ